MYTPKSAIAESVAVFYERTETDNATIRWVASEIGQFGTVRSEGGRDDDVLESVPDDVVSHLSRCSCSSTILHEQFKKASLLSMQHFMCPLYGCNSFHIKQLEFLFQFYREYSGSNTA